MPPRLRRRRALFVLAKVDEIINWEQRRDTDRDIKFVELGRYLCEVRAGQYWRLENLKSFEDFLKTKFPESRRKAYYLMSIHEQLPSQARQELKEVGWTKGVWGFVWNRCDGGDDLAKREVIWNLIDRDDPNGPKECWTNERVRFCMYDVDPS